MPSLAQSVLAYIRKHELLKAGDRVGAAVSGGADSVAMLRLLLELRPKIGIVLSVVHFNHKLRGAESDGDEQFVAELAQRHVLQFHCESGDVPAHAAEKHLSIETAAREMRYAYFRRLLADQCLNDGRVNRVATAHTLDDQAETVLMRVARGAGTRGLAGIYPQLPVASSRFSDGSIVRPLLGIRRNELEDYLKAIGQDWREDASNRDLHHARNRVRHGILPKLEEDLNPAVRQAFAETAEIARAEEDYWKQEVSRLLPTAWDSTRKALSLKVLLSLPLALQRRVIRASAESLGLRLEFRQVEEIFEVCSGSANSAELATGWRVSRSQQELRFQRAESPLQPIDYEYNLSLPGSVLVPEAGARIEAVLIRGDAGVGLNPGDLLDPAALATGMVVRNWRAGDRFWPAHSKAPKKIKELLQEKHIAGAVRRLWPVVACGSKVVWVRGLPGPAELQAKNGAEGALIQEVTLATQAQAMT